MSETPEQKEAFEKADQAVEEAGWREERAVEPWLRGSWFRIGWFGWLFRSGPRPGSPGLRDALHGENDDDEKT